MRSMKKTLSMLLASAMICGMLSACASTPATQETSAQSNATAQETSAQSAPETQKAQETEAATEALQARDIPEEEWLPLVKDGEEATLTIGILKKENVEDYDTNYLTKYLQEKTGVKIEFKYYSSAIAEAYQQLTLDAVDPNITLPDILLGWYSLGTSKVNEFGENGFAIDLTNLINEYGHYFWDAYDRSSEEVQELTWSVKDPTTNEMYTLPMIFTPQIDDVVYFPFINEAWLEKLGLEAPANIDELKTVLQAFVTQDPNGNGVNDELGIISPFTTNATFASYIMNAFIYYDQKNPLNIEEGKVYAPFTTAEWREGLKYINDLTKEGLIPSVSYTIAKAAENKAYVNGGEYSLAGIFCGHPLLGLDSSNERYNDYVMLQPLADATGKGNWAPVVPTTVYAGGAIITSDCQNPELAFKFIDFICSDDALRTIRFGEENVDWVKVSGEAYDYYGNKTVFTTLNADAFSSGNQNWHTNLWGLFTVETYNPSAETDDPYMQRLYSLYKDLYDLRMNYRQPEEKYANFTYTAEETEVLNEISSELTNTALNYIALFGTGEMDPYNDSDWESYLKELDALGLQDWISIVQDAYDRTK